MNARSTGQLLSERQSRNHSDSHAISPTSSTTTTRISTHDFAEMIAILCTSKLHVELDKAQMQVWWKLLCPFSSKTIRKAILLVSCRSDPFPNLGMIFEECRRVEGAADEGAARKIPDKQLSAIADELGWR